MDGSATKKTKCLWVHRFAAVFIPAAVFAGSIFLNTRNNTFPYGYHPDEPTKARQILSPTGFRNFLHPQLLLEVSQQVLNLSSRNRDIQQTTELGREVSATFAAIGVTALCITGYLEGGALGAFLVGAACMFCSSLVVSAHYFKEDTALILGLCPIVLASHCVMNGGSMAGRRMSIIFLGLACAIAASGKYVGAVFLIVGMVAVIATPAPAARAKFVRVLGMLAAFAIFCAAINYRVLANLRGFKSGFDAEAKHAVTEHFGLTMNHPNTFFIDNLPSEAGWPMLILGTMAMLVYMLTRTRRTAWDALTLFIGPGYLLVLSFASLPAGRYLLPTVIMLQFTAGLAAWWLIDLAPTNAWRAVGGIALAGAFILVGLPRCISVDRQFGDDSRDRLRAWLIANVPAHSIVVGDFYTGIVIHAENMQGEDTIGDGITAREVYDVSALGSVSSLSGQGVSYVAVSDRIYDRYFVPQFHAIADYKQEFADRRQWYLDLFSNVPVWRYDPPMNLHAATNPAIRVYRIEGSRPPAGIGNFP